MRPQIKLYVVAALLVCNGYPGSDRQQVAFGARGGLEIRECATSRLVRTWPTTGERGLLPAWSPDGRWVAFGGFDNSQLGLGVLEMSTSRAARVASGSCTMPALVKPQSDETRITPIVTDFSL
jgi:hypothetical protein